GSSLVHVTPGRLRVPLLPLEEQRRYGAAFRRVHELRSAVRRTAGLAADTAATLTTGLTAGALLPPDDPDASAGPELPESR
ncbi:SAM-dependent methyltransferase, partial [Streptomyces sp. SID11233]|nr:SAM-dependent methyltransferase [Streptomyces sp. SID11233]